MRKIHVWLSYKPKISYPCKVCDKFHVCSRADKDEMQPYNRLCKSILLAQTEFLLHILCIDMREKKNVIKKNKKNLVQLWQKREIYAGFSCFLFCGDSQTFCAIMQLHNCNIYKLCLTKNCSKTFWWSGKIYILYTACCTCLSCNFIH